MTAALQTRPHEILPCRLLISQDGWIEGMRFIQRDVDAPRHIQTLALQRQTVEVRGETAPTALDPTDEDWGIRQFLQDAPHTLTEQADRLILTAAKLSLRENEDATAAAQHGDGLAQLRRLAAKTGRGHADRADDVGHRPAHQR